MLKLLVLVLGVGAVAGRCPQDKFWSKVLSECVPCSKCTQSYLLRACLPERDSVCADEIRLTLDWLHPSKTTHHFSKNRLSSIEHDLYSTAQDLPKPFEKKKSKHFHFPEELSDKSKHKKLKKHYAFDDIDDKDYSAKDFGMEDNEFRKKDYGLEDKEFRKKDFGIEDREYNKKDYGMEDLEYRKKDVDLDEKWGHKKKWSASDEKTLEEWLRDSRDRLKIRKMDLLRTLKHPKGDFKDSPARRLNQPNRNVMSDILNGLVKHELHRDGASELLEELELANKAHQVKDELEEDEREEEDQAQRLIHLLASHDSPHRLFLGQPSTVSEIIGQVKEDGAYKSNVVLEKSTLHAETDHLNPDPLHDGESVVAKPFSAAEALVWDWQAVALISAVAACLLFFVIAAIYLLLSARDTKRIIADHDGEEMTTMVALMPPTDDHEATISKPRPIVIAKPGHGMGFVHSKSYARS